MEQPSILHQFLWLSSNLVPKPLCPLIAHAQRPKGLLYIILYGLEDESFKKKTVNVVIPPLLGLGLALGFWTVFNAVVLPVGTI